ncbi:MAG: FAD/FMN-containing dehydrogenase [Lentimonas sp.]|jgi:hypothetical protein
MTKQLDITSVERGARQRRQSQGLLGVAVWAGRRLEPTLSIARCVVAELNEEAAKSGKTWKMGQTLFQFPGKIASTIRW